MNSNRQDDGRQYFSNMKTMIKIRSPNTKPEDLIDLLRYEFHLPYNCEEIGLTWNSEGVFLPRELFSMESHHWHNIDTLSRFSRVLERLLISSIAEQSGITIADVSRLYIKVTASPQPANSKISQRDFSSVHLIPGIRRLQALFIVTAVYPELFFAPTKI